MFQTKKIVKKVLRSGEFPSFVEIGAGLDEAMSAAEEILAAAEDLTGDMEGFSVSRHESWSMEKFNNCTVVNIQVPGFSRDNIIVTTQGQSITVVQKALKASNEDGFMVPAHPGSTRKWNFSADYDMSKVRVRCKDGLLCVVVPRKLKEEEVHSVRVD